MGVPPWRNGTPQWAIGKFAQHRRSSHVVVKLLLSCLHFSLNQTYMYYNIRLYISMCMWLYLYQFICRHRNHIFPIYHFPSDETCVTCTSFFPPGYSVLAWWKARRGRTDVAMSFFPVVGWWWLINVDDNQFQYTVYDSHHLHLHENCVFPVLWSTFNKQFQHCLQMISIYFSQMNVDG